MICSLGILELYYFDSSEFPSIEGACMSSASSIFIPPEGGHHYQWWS
jgi:hypothetical protein